MRVIRVNPKNECMECTRYAGFLGSSEGMPPIDVWEWSWFESWPSAFYGMKTISIERRRHEMTQHPVQPYTVIVLLNGDGSKVLLTKKDRTSFAGMLNGVGGKIEVGEAPMDGAYREIKEETALEPEDIEMLTWLGILTIPEQCDEKNADKYPELYFYSGIVNDESKAHKPDSETKPIGWYEIGKDNKPIADLEIAGDGDLQYFIGRARKWLFNIG